MKKLDFLPNRQNKYSIRKFTVGTASILLGTILISGATEEAKAAETTGTSNNSAATSSSSTDTSNTQATDTTNTGATTTNTQSATSQQPTDSSKDASTATQTQAPSTSTSGATQATQAQAPTTDTTQSSSANSTTSTTQTPDAAPAPETKAGSTTDQSAGNTTSTPSSADTTTSTNNTTTKTPDTNATAPSSATSGTNNTAAQAPSSATDANTTTPAPDTNATAPTSGSNATVTAAPTTDTNTAAPSSTTNAAAAPSSATVSAPLAQDVTSALSGSTNQTQALTDYLTTQNNLTPEAAQQVVNGMNVDLTNATSDQISNALIASYLLNSQNAPGSNPVADTSTTQSTTTQSQTSPTSRMMMRSLAAVQAPATQVGTWDEYVAAMNDTSVSNIQLTSDITANKLGTLNTGTGRTVTVDGGGHTLDTGNFYVNAPVTSGNWDITLANTNLKTNHPEGFINFAPSTTTQNTLTLRDVTHTGTNIINDTVATNNVTVNLQGNVTSTSTDNATGRATIGAKNINIAPNATVNMTRTGLGSAFQVSDNGSIKTATGSAVNVDVSAANPWGVTNGNTAFKAGNNVTIQLGDGTTTNVKGQNIFDFGNGGTLNTGIGSTVNVDQKGNGNIVNMGTDSTFEVAKDAKFIAYSDGHRVGDWQVNNLIGLDGNSQILVDENATLFLDAKNHQWNPDTQTQVGAYNDLVNINATGNQTALLHVANNATLDLRTDNRDYYAEVISIPLGGSNPDRRYIFDNAYYVNLQKTSKVTSGESPNGQKPNLIFMDPGSPGYFQWNGSYIAKTWDPMVFSDPSQSADATNVWQDVVDLRAEQNGFNTGVPTYNQAESTLTSTKGTPLNQLNLNYAQRLVLISNNSKNPEAVPPATTTETIPPNTTYQPNPDPTKPIGDKTVITPGTPGEQTVTTEPGKDPVIVVTTPPTDQVVGVNNQTVVTTPIPHNTTFVGVDQPVDYENVRTPGVDGSTTTTTTYTVNPTTGELSNPQSTTATKDPVTEVIEVGTKQVSTAPIPYETIVRNNPNLPAGTQNEIQPGITGLETTTTTYTVNPDTGRLENPSSNTVVTTPKQDRIIEVGTGTTSVVTNPIPNETTYQPNPDPSPQTGGTTVITPGTPGTETITTEPGKDPVKEVTTPPVTEVIGVDNESTVTTPIPHDTINRYNPNLPVGAKDVLVQEGKDGSTTSTTIYTVDPKTGQLTNPQTTTTTTPPVDRITEYGPVDGGTVYKPDPNLPKGETSTTPGKPGDPNDPNNPPTDTVISVGNVEETTSVIPHETTFVGVDEPVGYTNVQTPGKDGSTTTTTTYQVDPKTGALINPTTKTTTTNPVTQVNQVGTKEVTTAPVPYETITRYNPNLPAGTQNEVQPGITGQTQTTTTYTVNPNTGALESPVSNTVTTIEKQDRIIEVGTGTTSVVTNPIPNETTYEPNPDPTKPVGDKTVITPGQPGTETVTTEPGKDPVTEVTTPPVTEVVGVNNQTVETTPIPHETINRYNPNLPVGAKDVVVQEGKDGSKTTTTTYTVDPKTGQLTNPQSSTETTPPVDRITEYGPVEGGTIYKPDPNLPKGETSTTPGKPGDPNDPNNPPTDTVIHVGNKVVDENEVPYETIYRDNPNLPAGTEKEIQPGVTGKTQTITTYDVDPKTGELTNPRTETVTVTVKQDRIIERGTGGKTPAVIIPDGPGTPGETPTQPEKPGETPTQPEKPGETPTQPEKPGETPTQPEGPGETPAQPEGPAETPAQPEGPAETPTQPEGPAETPAQPEGPAETPAQPTAPATSNAVSNDESVPTPSKERAADKSDKAALPDTGENNSNNGTLFGSLFAGLGAMFLLGKKRRRKDEK